MAADPGASLLEPTGSTSGGVPFIPPIAPGGPAPLSQGTQTAPPLVIGSSSPSRPAGPPVTVAAPTQTTTSAAVAAQPEVSDEVDTADIPWVHPCGPTGMHPFDDPALQWLRDRSGDYKGAWVADAADALAPGPKWTDAAGKEYHVRICRNCWLHRKGIKLCKVGAGTSDTGSCCVECETIKQSCNYGGHHCGKGKKGKEIFIFAMRFRYDRGGFWNPAEFTKEEKAAAESLFLQFGDSESACQRRAIYEEAEAAIRRLDERDWQEGIREREQDQAKREQLEAMRKVEQDLADLVPSAGGRVGGDRRQVHATADYSTDEEDQEHRGEKLAPRRASTRRADRQASAGPSRQAVPDKTSRPTPKYIKPASKQTHRQDGQAGEKRKTKEHNQLGPSMSKRQTRRETQHPDGFDAQALDKLRGPSPLSDDPQAERRGQRPSPLPLPLRIPAPPPENVASRGASKERRTDSVAPDASMNKAMTGTPHANPDINAPSQRARAPPSGSVARTLAPPGPTPTAVNLPRNDDLAVVRELSELANNIRDWGRAGWTREDFSRRVARDFCGDGTFLRSVYDRLN